ncbi:MAG: patatin-like phospholipase family protein, partial [Ramlibacter sp.]
LCAAAAPAPAPAAAPGRPRIGLVLGGGGARGTAHIGVLEVLERLRVPVDCLAGTSMGALVAGAWAGGVSTAQMRQRLAAVDWYDLFDDNPSHAETNYRERLLAQSYYPGLEFGITNEGIRAAHGVVGGQKIKLFFNTLVGADRGERRIEDLALPVAIVATDIGTGEKLVFRSGELSAAMRASMSVPALLAPVPYRGRYLVDGGLVDNLPVDEVMAACQPDVVIAVDVGSPLARPEDMTTMGAITGQTIGVLTEQNAERSRAMLKPGDIYIRPRLAGITAADFNEFRAGAESGREAAQAQAAALARYALPQADYDAWAARLQRPQPPSPRVDEVQITGLKRVNPAFVARHIRIRAGDRFDAARLERDLARVYGDGDVENVDYSLVTVEGRTILRIAVTEKSWGPDYVRSGVFIEATDRETEFAVRGALHRKWLNSLGAQWLSGFQVGERSSLYTEFYQPFDARQRWFAEPALGFKRDRLNVYENDNRVAEYLIRQKQAFFNLGANIGVLGALRVGYLYRKLDASVETGATTLPSGDTTLKGWQVLLEFDQFDRPFFPSTGWYGRLGYYNAQDGAYSRLSADLRAARTWGPYVVNGRYAYLSSPKGRLPLGDAGALGGFLQLSGYARDQILAGDLRIASVRGERIIARSPFGLRGDLRVGLSLEAGRAHDRFTETGLDGWQQAGAIYLGGETPLGPLYVGAGYAKGGHRSLYLFLGLP